MERQIKPCPFCGCIPEVNGDVVTHRHNGEICIVDDTQYDIEKWNKRADGWISVKDRLPKECRCLVYSPIYNENSEMTMRIIDSQFVKLLTDATHWMPLPEAPK